MLTSRLRSLVVSGDDLAAALTTARRQLQVQSASEAFVRQHFHEIAGVREQLSRLRCVLNAGEGRGVMRC